MMGGYVRSAVHDLEHRSGRIAGLKCRFRILEYTIVAVFHCIGHTAKWFCNLKVEFACHESRRISLARKDCDKM